MLGSAVPPFSLLSHHCPSRVDLSLYRLEVHLGRIKLWPARTFGRERAKRSLKARKSMVLSGFPVNVHRAEGSRPLPAEWETVRPAEQGGCVHPSQYLGPGPFRPAMSAGFARPHRSIDRQPQPMHSADRRRCNSAMRWSMRFVHSPDNRDQSRRVGTRSSGNLASSAPRINPRHFVNKYVH